MNVKESVNKEALKDIVDALTQASKAKVMQHLNNVVKLEEIVETYQKEITFALEAVKAENARLEAQIARYTKLAK